MAEKLLSEPALKEMLRKAVKGREQKEVAAAIGVSQSFLSGMLRERPITGKILKWLGYRRSAKRFYEKVGE
jgi:hypothetical protein